MAMMNALVASLGLLATLQLPEAGLIEAHRSGIELIQSLDLKCEQYRSEATKPGQVRIARFEWLKSPNRDKLTEILYGMFGPDNKWSEGKRSIIRLYVPEARYELHNYDEENPPTLPLTHERKYSGVKGFIFDEIRADSGKGAIELLLLLNPASKTLKALLDGSRDRVVRGPMDRNGTKVYEITCVDNATNFRYTIYLDPAKNFAISERKAIWPIDRKLGRLKEFVETAKVLNFVEPKPGIFFPEAIEWSSDDDPSVVRTKVTSITVNEPMSEASFAPWFPEGLPVGDTRGGKTVIKVWGKTEPVASFDSEDQFRVWVANNVNRNSMIGPGIRIFILCNALFGVALLCIVLLKRQARRRASG